MAAAGDDEHQVAKAGRGYTAKNQRKPIPVSSAVGGEEARLGSLGGRVQLKLGPQGITIIGGGGARPGGQLDESAQLCFTQLHLQVRRPRWKASQTS